MFPLRWDFPFRKKDGSLSTISAEIEGGGGGGYTLPTASASTKGGIKIGEGLRMLGEFLNAEEQLPTYSATEEGKVLSVDSEGELEWTTPGGGGGTSITSETQNITAAAYPNIINQVPITPPAGKTPIACTIEELQGYTQRYWIVSLSKNNSGIWSANFFFPSSESGGITLACKLTVYYI